MLPQLSRTQAQFGGILVQKNIQSIKDRSVVEAGEMQQEWSFLVQVLATCKF